MKLLKSYPKDVYKRQPLFFSSISKRLDFTVITFSSHLLPLFFSHYLLLIISSCLLYTSLKKRTAHGQVISLTSNTITIKSKKGKTATYPITGTKQYYQNGIKAGDWVYLTFKGKFPDTSNDSSVSLNASHLKVLSISDLKDLEIPDPCLLYTSRPDKYPALRSFWKVPWWHPDVQMSSPEPGLSGHLPARKQLSLIHI